MQPIPSQPDLAPVFDWGNRASNVAFTDGLTASFCPGAAPLVCLYERGVPRAQIELIVSQIDTQASTPTLAERVAEYYATFTRDRALCGKGFKTTTQTPQNIVVAGEPGIKAVLTVLDAAALPVERYAVYLAEHDGTLVAFTNAAYAPGGCFEAEVPYATIDNLTMSTRAAIDALIRSSNVPHE